MLISESWLREWASPKIGSDELAERLTLAGLEVDSVESAGPSLDNKKIIVGQIVSAEPHPNATNLQICEVDVSKSRNLSIVCGAVNAKTGMKTAVALAKARLPGRQVSAGEIHAREIHGVKSNGMLCSAAELGLADSSDGIFEFDSGADVGRAVGDYLDLQDYVFQLELTPNRGDCLSIAGVAREVATLTGANLNIPEISKAKIVSRTALKVQLKAPEGCPRYVGRAITNIDMQAKTPDWMVERLRRSGMRSINPIVDITNYVMHELGQPMHAFDLKKIRGGIVVRMAKNGEKIKLLDGSSVKLAKHDLVIADQSKAIALAGIMGAANSAISGKSRDIYLESAFFSCAVILGKARQLGLHTDASHRFERGVDSELQLKAMERATALVVGIAGGQAGPVTHTVEKSSLPKTPDIAFHKSEIYRVLGMTVPNNKIVSIMKNLGMSVKSSKIGWQVKPPSWRYDIQGQHDLIEEVGRCFGFEKVPPRMPDTESGIGAHPENKLSLYDIKQTLIHRGYHEAITYSFVDSKFQQQLLNKSDAIRLINPIADNMSVMRQSLWPGLLEALKSNLNRQEDRVRLFETGHVYAKAQNSRKSEEKSRLGGLISGISLPRQWASQAAEVDFFDIKGDLEALINLTGSTADFQLQQARHPALHPGQCAQIFIGKKRIGFVGKLHPSHQKIYDLDQAVYLFEIDLEPLSSCLLPVFLDISKFPSMQRDLAVLVDQTVNVQPIMELVRSSAGGLLRNLELFDVYRGDNLEKNKKSFAFGLTFQSESSNLTALEVEAVMEKIVEVLEQKMDARLRK
ncbi:phenylalanine--tRNA ligase subunit beta [Candidatus Spongiihabitans sp.]|uniref:phenylalanine--tRNA ligase subunit beta n=1 Tax=Candidatus Spongiihabitans sp. TaxID=3101308 RepID=UPI003C6F7F56